MGTISANSCMCVLWVNDFKWFCRKEEQVKLKTHEQFCTKVNTMARSNWSWFYGTRPYGLDRQVVDNKSTSKLEGKFN